jgi:hypothetical protein
VRRRDRAGLQNFFGLYRVLATSWRVYHNSGAVAPRLVAAGRADLVTRITDRRAWESPPGKGEMMKRERLTRIGRIFVEGTLVDRAVEAAARDALALHKRAGVPVVVCRGGKIATVSARTLLRARSAARRRSRDIRASAKDEGA